MTTRLLALLLLVPTLSSAQTVTGTLQGTVTDTSGGVLPGVTITIKHVGHRRRAREPSPTTQGFYIAPFLPIGGYSVTAALTGFGTVVRERRRTSA